MTIEEGEFKVFYKCNPEKNEQCKKSGCHITGGSCYHTTNAAYAEDATKAIMVVPMTQEEWDEISNIELGSPEVKSSPAPLQLHPSLEPRNRKEKCDGRKK